MDLQSFNEKAQASFWITKKVNLSGDRVDFLTKLNDSERFFLKRILCYFAAADSQVQDNLVGRFGNEVQYLEARNWYQLQGAIEVVHSEIYSLLIDVYADGEEKAEMFNAVHTDPAIRQKAQWAQKWIDSPTASFAERLVGFAAVEGIFFSSSFASIFWLRKRGILPGLQEANGYICRDEGLHTAFACHLYRHHIVHKLPVERVLQIVGEAVKIEHEFVQSSLPVSLLGMNATSMCEYIEYTADRLLQMLGYPKFYNAKQPFDFMKLIDMQSIESQFEVEAINYKEPTSEQTFSLDEDI